MPALTSHHSSSSTKLLFIADSGAGKSGALASLADIGYNLRVVDLDNGIDVLANILRHAAAYGYSSEALGRVVYETLTDPMKPSGNKLIPVAATAWTRTIELLNRWKISRWEGVGPDRKEIVDYDLGSILTWTPLDCLCIDSLTFLSIAALNFVLKMNARLGQRPHQSDWYDGQQMVESLLQMLYDENVRCNVIVSSHITYIGEDGGLQHGYASSLGKALSPKIGRYFNSCLMAKTSGSGANVQRKIITQSTALIELKNTNPAKVKAEYPLTTGLADYFADVRGLTKDQLRAQLAEMRKSAGGAAVAAS